MLVTYAESVYTSARLFVQLSELGPPPPHPLAIVAPPFGSKGETHLLTVEGVGGGTQFDEGTDTLVLYVYCNFSTLFTLSEILR